MTRGEEGGNDPWSAPLFTQREPGLSACSQASLKPALVRGAGMLAVLELTGHFVDPVGQKPNTLNPDLIR